MSEGTFGSLFMAEKNYNFCGMNILYSEGEFKFFEIYTGKWLISRDRVRGWGCSGKWVNLPALEIGADQ